jgi:hypothetical protein
MSPLHEPRICCVSSEGQNGPDGHREAGNCCEQLYRRQAPSRCEAIVRQAPKIARNAMGPRMTAWTKAGQVGLVGGLGWGPGWIAPNSVRCEGPRRP